MNAFKLGCVTPFLALLGLASSVANAQQIGIRWVESSSYFQDSLASPDAIKRIKAGIYDWVQAHQTQADREKPFDEKIIQAHRSEFVAFLNGLLTKENLPKIDVTSSDFKIEATVPWPYHRYKNDFQGVSVQDQKTKFCLPCEVGYNNYVSGVIPNVEAPRNPNGRNYRALSCFQSLDKVAQHEQNFVNSENRAGTKFIAIPGKNAGREGFYAVTDDGTYFYPAQLPGGFTAQRAGGWHEEPCVLDSQKTCHIPYTPMVMFRSYRITLPNGKKTQVGIRVNNVSDPAHPGTPTPEHVDAFEVTYDQGMTDPDGKPPVDLGVGAGDKLGPEATAAIHGELLSRLSDFERANGGNKSEPYSELIQLLAKRSDLCSALDSCKDSGAFERDELLAKLYQIKTDFSCQSPQVGQVEERTEGITKVDSSSRQAL